MEENLWLRGLGVCCASRTNPLKIHKCNRLLGRDLEIKAAAAILEGGRAKAKEIPMGAYLRVVMNANAGVFLEVGKMENGTLTFDDVLAELGLTAKWKAEDREKGREEVARNALAKGLPPDVIGEITGLTSRPSKALPANNSQVDREVIFEFT